MVAPGGECGCSRGEGGMHGCSGGRHAWLLVGGCVWLLPGGGVWLLLGGVHGCSWGGVCGCSGVCVVARGGHAWDTTRYGDTVNERAVRILLECILVVQIFLECNAARRSI